MLWHLMKLLICLLFVGFSSYAIADDPMLREEAHEATEKKVEGYDLDKIKSLPDETIINWVLCPGYELGKDEVIKLVNNEDLSYDGEHTSVKIKLTKDQRKEDEKHIALLWANDVEGENLAKEKATDDEMEFFKDEKKLLLEKGKWKANAFEYTYRWPGDKEKNKSIKVTVDITVKDSSTEIGKFLEEFLNRIKGGNKNPNKKSKSSPNKAAPSSQPSSTFAQQQPSTSIVQPGAPPLPPTVIYQQSPPVVYGAPYYGPPVVGGVWIGGGWGHRHHHHHWW